MSDFFQGVLRFLYSYWGVILVAFAVFEVADLMLSKAKKRQKDRLADKKRKKIMVVVTISITIIIMIWGVLATVFLTEVPDIVGCKYGDAKRILEDRHLKMDFDSKENEWEIADYTIKTQNPSSEEIVKRKEIVKVTIVRSDSVDQFENRNRSKDDLPNSKNVSSNLNELKSSDAPIPSPSTGIPPKKETSIEQPNIQIKAPITSRPQRPSSTQGQTQILPSTPTPTPTPPPTPTPTPTPVPIDLSVSVSYTIIPIPITDNNLTITAYTNRQADCVTVTAVSESNSFGPFNMKTGDYSNWYFPANFYEKGTYVVTVTAYSSDGVSASDSFSVTYPF